VIHAKIPSDYVTEISGSRSTLLGCIKIFPMKTILVPTDFSKASNNALDYAVEIAKKTGSKLILFHCYAVPIVATDVMVVPPVNEMEKAGLAGLKRLSNSLIKKHGKKITVTYKNVYGSPLDSIDEFVGKNKVDLIVMGMQGGGLLTEKLIGSTATSVMRKVKCPILCINKSVKFKLPKKILLACDFENAPGSAVLRPLKELATLFRSSVLALYVLNEFQTVPPKGTEKINTKLKHALADVKHSFNFVKNISVVKGINDFARKQKADMIVMIPHKHPFYEALFFEYDSKRMAFHTPLPLLTLLR
jgi:nucleotide-binding universal stress UspA family protein